MTEKQVHENICLYLKSQYPKVIFTTDLSGIKLTMGQAVQVKKLRSSNGIPDLLIFKPKKSGNIIYHGLFLELKRDGEKIYKKDGEMKTEHLKKQFDMMIKLCLLGYSSHIAIGFEHAKSMIDNYMKLEDL